MKHTALSIATLLLICACNRDSSPTATPTPQSAPPAAPRQTLADARQGFKTHLTQHIHGGDPIDTPPPGGIFKLVSYTSPVGPLAAYITPDPRDNARHPAIIWITGGDCNSIGDVWSPAPATNDQSAAAYRKAGILMMFPSLRGGNKNPGEEEGLYGEADDILAAADYLAKQPGVDTDRIYLGGHSTGGTMVLLVAEYSDRFRAVFSFGPVDSPARYSPGTFEQPWDASNPREVELRSPGKWLASIAKPTFVFEGGKSPSNAAALTLMSKNKNTSPNVHFFPAPNVSHFSILAPLNRLIAQKILADIGKDCNISFTQAEMDGIR